MLTERQNLIFKSIVDEFVSTADPVSSKILIEKYNINYSSATVRNEMVELENMGLIEKTHTSSGRIPSVAGYRYYVEFLMEKVDTSNYELAIKAFVENSYQSVEDAIKNASDIISQMTNLTSIVLGPDAYEHRLQHIQLFPIDERSAVAIFITDSGHTENRVFKFSDDVTMKDIQVSTDIMNSRLQGTMVKDVGEKLESIRPILAEAVSRHEVIYNAFALAFSKFTNDNVYFSGETNIINQPDFVDLERIKQLMLMLQDHQLWRNVSRGEADLYLERSDKAQLSWIEDLVVVSTNLRISNNESAKILLVGPSRMDYERIISLIEVLSDSLEMVFIEGGKDEEES